MRQLIYIIILVASVSFPNVTYSQSLEKRMNFEIVGGTGLKNKGTVPIDFSFRFLFKIVPISYVFVDVEEDVSLHSEGQKRYYTSGHYIGGGLGLSMLNKLKTNHALDIRIKALGNVGKTNWKHTTYDACLSWYLKNVGFSPIVELGYKFMDSKIDSYSNYNSIYMSIGLRY